MLPTGKPLGKMPSPPVVMTLSPGWTSSSAMTFSSIVSPFGLPRTMPCRRNRSTIASQAAGLIVDQQYLSGMSVRLQNLPNHSLCSDDRHVLLEAIFSALSRNRERDCSLPLEPTT